MAARDLIPPPHWETDAIPNRLVEVFERLYDDWQLISLPDVDDWEARGYEVAATFTAPDGTEKAMVVLLTD